MFARLLGALLFVVLSFVGHAAAQTWSLTGAMDTARYLHTATLLPGGDLLVTGGTDHRAVFASAELYDPAQHTWSPTGAMHAARYSHTATLLQDGRVLVSGGSDASGIDLATAEIYDPAVRSWSMTGSMSTARVFHTATLLP